MKRPPHAPRPGSARKLIELRLKQVDDLQGKFMRHLRMKPDDLEGAAQLLVQLQRARKAVPQSHWLSVDAVRLHRNRSVGCSASDSTGEAL